MQSTLCAFPGCSYMQIPYEVGVSEFGSGLFATAFVSTGTLVWKYASGVNIREFNKQAATAHLSTMTLNEAQRFLDLTYGQRGLLCEVLDDGKYMNHSENPNCKTNEVGDTYTIRDLHPGDELYEDYATFDHPDFLYELLEKYDCAPNYYQMEPRKVDSRQSAPNSRSPNIHHTEIVETATN